MDYRTLTKATSDGFANQPRKQEKKANEENMTMANFQTCLLWPM